MVSLVRPRRVRQERVGFDQGDRVSLRRFGQAGSGKNWSGKIGSIKVGAS